MTSETFTKLLSAALALFPAFIGGCGDYPSGSSVESHDIGPRSALIELGGRTVYLRRHSTRCGLPASNPLVAEVGAGIEFPSDQTSKLESPCARAPNPGIEISVDGPSLIFDFSNVDEAGVFPLAEFEGYELGFARRCGDPVLATVALDASQTTVRATDLELSHHYDRIRVDFEGMAYDRTAFVKVDLQIVDVDCVGDEEAPPGTQTKIEFFPAN